jgi:phosphoribosyl 1,2-cyclic phosphodiesterase
MLKIQSLASGSRGNVTYIASETVNILVDLGLSLPQLLRRMQKANINPTEIDAILITHEHTDHIAGLEPFLKKFGGSLHLHTDTLEIFGNIPKDRITCFDKAFKIGDIEIDYFSVPHDSAYCFGYTFRNGEAKISLTTDLGRISDTIIDKMADSQIVLIECNHDLLRLSNNKKYPLFLKRRITSPTGHLSNPASALAIYELAKKNIRQVILAHLSEQNNSPTLAYNFVRSFLEKKGLTEGVDISVDVARQDEISMVFQID